MTAPAAAIVLAGGRGRRLGDVDKPELADRDGRTLLDRALAAVSGALVIVVGPPRDLPATILSVRERPPGGGPAAAVAAGCASLGGDPALAHLVPPEALVAVLAADLPNITAGTVGRLCAALDAHPEAGGAVMIDSGLIDSGLIDSGLIDSGLIDSGLIDTGLINSAGRRQYLVGVWRQGALLAAVRRRESWHGAALKELLMPIPVVELPALGDETADIDTPDDLRKWRGQ